MTIQPMLGKRICCRTVLTSLALLLTTLLGAGQPKSAWAATITVSDQASCEAIGGVWNSNPQYCGGSVTIKAGDTVILRSFGSFNSVTNNGVLSNQSSGYFYVGALTNNAGATLSSQVINISGTGLNYGTIATSSSRIASPGNLTIGVPFTNGSTGVILLPGNALMYLGADINNQGTILLGCGAAITYGNHNISGNPPLAPDCTGPTANPIQSPSVVANGWTDSDVTVNWRWRDNTEGSGLDTANCTTSSKSSGEGEQTLTATCQDRIGNVSNASYTVKVDKSAPVANPTLSPAPNGAGWNNTNVTVNWNWTDSGSGVDAANCATTSNSSQSNGAQTLTAFCFDQMGNLAQASYTVKVDRAWPQISANVNPPANGFGWNNSAVTVSFTCQEQGTGSGLATNTVGGNVTMSSEGAYPAVTNTGMCKDNADNVATSVTVGPFKLDLTKPTISAAATTAPNANGWYNSDVTIHYTCTDALSGIAFCPADQTLSNEGSAVASPALTSRDRAQNVSESSNIVTVNLDKTAPLVAVTGVTDGASYGFGSVPTAACSTSDALAGVATLATVSITGGNGDGSGTFTATCNGATDLAGNSAAAVSVSYTVGTPPPTATPTNTPVPPTATPVPPTATPTNTAVPPTATMTSTPVPPTATPTNTPVPPTVTNTVVPLTATPTNTSVPPTATPTVSATTLYATVQQVRNTLTALLPSGDSKTDQALQKAITKLEQGLSPDFWQLPNGNHLSTQGEKAFHRLRDAIKELRTLKTSPNAVTTAINTVSGVGRTLAEQAIAEATAAGGNAKQLTKANKELTKAQQDLAKQRPDLAFAHYEEAWETAQSALGIVLAASDPAAEHSVADPEHVHDVADEDESSTDTIVVQHLFLPLITR